MKYFKTILMFETIDPFLLMKIFKFYKQVPFCNILIVEFR